MHGHYNNKASIKSSGNSFNVNPCRRWARLLVAPSKICSLIAFDLQMYFSARKVMRAICSDDRVSVEFYGLKI